LFGGEQAWIVGGAVRDQALGRPVVDVDVALAEPERAARLFARKSGGAPFPLSERHGAWRVALDDGRTVDFTPLTGSIEEDLATRDFSINAIAERAGSDESVDPYNGYGDLAAGRLRAIGDSIFRDDPLRLLRGPRLEDELDFRLDPDTAALIRRDADLVTSPAKERILGELRRLSAFGFRRLEALGLLDRLGGSLADAGRLGAARHPDYDLVVVFGENLVQLPISNETRRFARSLLRAKPPTDDSPRAIHRFRRATEPWALEALAYLGAGEFRDAVLEAREREPKKPLVRGGELGLPPGPEIGRLLEQIAEERAAGTITTKEEALEYARRNAGSVRCDG
jgi:Poly A polymerase head domain/Probable RNA and SrmB- binding site of polymerase A